MKNISFCGEVDRFVRFKPHCDIGEPTHEIFIEPGVDISEKIHHSLVQDKSRITLIIGPWGSGKSVQLKHFMKKEKKRFEFEEVFFFGTQSLAEGMMHLTSFQKRVSISILIALFFGGITTPYSSLVKIYPVLDNSNVKTTAVTFGSIIGFAIFSNRARVFYFVGALFSSFCSTNKVVCIEDLDRSSMSKSDRWALLSTLWAHKRQYIVTYGFSDSVERLELYELATKLEAQIIDLPLDAAVNHKIAKLFFDSFPFETATWMTIFPARELSRIIKDELGKYPDEKNNIILQLAMVRRFYKEVTSLVIPEEEDREGLQFSVTNNQASIHTESLKLSEREHNLIRAYGHSISSAVITEVMGFASTEQRMVSNWQDVIIRTFIHSEAGYSYISKSWVKNGC